LGYIETLEKTSGKNYYISYPFWGTLDNSGNTHYCHEEEYIPVKKDDIVTINILKDLNIITY